MSAIPMFGTTWTPTRNVTRTTAEATTFEDESTPWQQVLRQLAQIRGYQKDWDGFGADAPSARLIDVAAQFLLTLRERNINNPPGNVALSPDSTEISFTWRWGDTFVQAEIIGSTEMVEWMIIRANGKTEFFEQRATARATADWETSWQGDKQITAATASV